MNLKLKSEIAAHRAHSAVSLLARIKVDLIKVADFALEDKSAVLEVLNGLDNMSNQLRLLHGLDETVKVEIIREKFSA